MKGIAVLLIWVTLGGAHSGPAEAAEPNKISVKDYQEKVYASWLAQCVGNIYGLPHECQ